MALSISWRVSTAALALCSERLLICPATTANPLPASPARAASIAALSERRFVWLAISSISEMIFSICLDVSLMRPITSTMPCISVWLWSASSAYSCAILYVSLSFSDVFSTPPVISANVAWSSSMAADWSIVPSAISCAAWARLLEPAVTSDDISLICDITSFICVFIWRIAMRSPIKSPVYLSSMSDETV